MLYRSLNSVTLISIKHSERNKIMAEIKFSSALSIEEIEENFKKTDFFSNITESLNEIIVHEKELGLLDKKEDAKK